MRDALEQHLKNASATENQDRALRLRSLMLLGPNNALRAQGVSRLSALYALLPEGVDFCEEMTMPPTSQTEAPASLAAGREVITLSTGELQRLRRLVQLVTVTIGEINLWLATAGAPIEEEDR